MPEQSPRAGSRITIAPTAVVQSRAFQTHYPRIINENLIHRGPKARMRESWDQDTFPPRDIQIFRIGGAIVAGECLILNQQLQFIENASGGYSDQEIGDWVGAVQAAQQAGRVKHHGGLTILTKRRAVHNYGHFMIDMLPMAWLGAQYTQDKNVRFLVHKVPAPSMDFTLRALRLLGINLDNVDIQDDKPLLFSELLVVRGISQHGTYMSPVCVATLDHLARRLMETTVDTPARGPDRIFVRRVPGWRRGRELHNEAEVARRLEAQGFAIIEPGVMPLEQQIIHFSSARHVVGVSGAAMTNIAFCRPGTRVTILVPGTFPDTFFWFIAQHKQLDYVEIRGNQTSYEGAFSWDAGFTLSNKDIDWIENVRLHE